MRKFFLAGMAAGALATANAHATSPDTVGAPKSAVAASHSQAERGKVAGTVDSIDSGAGAINLNTLGGVKHFTLSPDTKIVRYGRPATVADISRGGRVRSLRYDKKTNRAIRIELGSR